MPRKTLVLDSTQLTQWLECPYMWSCLNVDKITSSNEVSNSISLGSYGHKLLEIYYKELAQVPANLAASRALSFDPLSSDEFKKSKLTADDIKSVQERFNLYWMTYCIKDFEVLRRTRYHIEFDQFGNGIDSTVEEPIVEQGFSYVLLDSKEYLFVLEGRIDLMAILNGNQIFVDHKWQIREHNLYQKSIQFKNYSLATGLNLGLINYVRLHKNVSKTTLQRQAISFSSTEIREWKQELIEIFIRISQAIHHKDFIHNWASCPGRFGYHCQFTKICEESSNPDLIPIIKRSYFEPKQEWKPW